MNRVEIKKRKVRGSFLNLTVSVLSLQMAILPVQAHATDWVAQSTIQNQLSNDVELSIDDIVKKTGIGVDEDIGTSIYNIPASQATSLSTTQVGRGQVSVYGIYDISNAVGTISVLNIRRNSDRSATLLQKAFTPYSFDSVASGGDLLASQATLINTLYGGNPFNEFKDATNKLVFANIKPEAFVTAMGLAMKNTGANYAMYAEMSTRADVQTKKSGGKLRKKITTTLNAYIKPTWSLLVPVGTVGADVVPASGASFDTNAPIFGYRTATGKSVNSGVQLVGMGDGTNLNTSETLIFTHSETKKSWTLLSVMVVAAVTGGVAAGLGALALGAVGTMSSTIGTGMITGVAGSFTTSWINGNTNLTAPVDHNMIFNVTGKANINSFEMPSSAFNQWKVEARKKVIDGPMASSLPTVATEFASEKSNWNSRTPNGRNSQRANPEDPFPNILK